MSPNFNYSRPTVLKALHWLNEQPHRWAHHIKDSNIAVRMYLKSQKQNRESNFKKEIQKFIKDSKLKSEDPPGAILRKNLKLLDQTSPPADRSEPEQKEWIQTEQKNKGNKAQAKPFF